MVVNCPPKETCGKPMSSGFVVTPSRPVLAANGFPAFGLVCPPATVRNANRASFRNSAEKTCVQPATPFRVWVLRLRPNPGNRLSCSTSRSKRVELARIEQREAREGRVVRGKLMIQLRAGIIAVDALASRGEQVLARFPASLRAEYSPAAPWTRSPGPVMGMRFPGKGWRTAQGGAVRVVDQRQSREVAGSHRIRGDRERTGQRFPDPLAFVVGEEERSILDHRSAQASAELVLAERRDRRRLRIEKILRVENIVAHELEQAAVELIRSGLGDDIDHRAGLASELGSIGRLLNVEFADGFDGGSDHHVVEMLVGHGRAIDQIQVVSAALPQDVDQRSGLLHGVAASPAGGPHHAFAQHRQVQKLPALQGRLTIWRLWITSLISADSGWTSPVSASTTTVSLASPTWTVKS